MKERLITFLAYLMIGQDKFEKNVGLSSGFVNKVGDSIREVNLKKILDKYPELNINWLKTGEGNMLKPTVKNELNISGGKYVVASNISGSHNRNIGNISTRVVDGVTGDLTAENTKGIPLIPFDFIAGYGEDNAGISLNDCDRYIIPEFEHIGAEFLVRVGGSSMYPKYSSGDILACKKIHDILFFQWGKIYVIDSSQGQLIKRIFEHENEEFIMLVSDNKEKYPPFPMPKSDIRSLSIVMGVVRME